jgi:hypothetical protein
LTFSDDGFFEQIFKLGWISNEKMFRKSKQAI